GPAMPSTSSATRASSGRPRCTEPVRDLLCVGNAVADTSARPVTKLPGRGKLVFIDEIGLNPGGCATLSAMAGARLGLKTGVGIAVGRDPYGDFLVEKLAK